MKNAVGWRRILIITGDQDFRKGAKEVIDWIVDTRPRSKAANVARKTGGVRRHRRERGQDWAVFGGTSQKSLALNVDQQVVLREEVGA